MSAPVLGRFAPSPSGALHLGNLFCFLLCWLSAKSKGGQVLMRIEDLDPARTDRAYAQQAEDDLRFLGLTWDRGGLAGGPASVQSLRSDFYGEMLARLGAKGLVYPCFCSRAQLHAASAPHASDGEPIYDGHCRALTAERAAELSKKRKPALRLKVGDAKITFTDGHYGTVTQDLSTQCGDFILRRSDGVYAYQLAVAADDGAMGVTEVVRGRDLLPSSPRQIYLHRLLGFTPPEFIHTPLLLAADGRRLSKRDGDLSLSGLRAKGFSAEDILGRLAFLAGLLERPEPVTARELVSLFSWERVPKEDVLLPPGWFVS